MSDSTIDRRQFISTGLGLAAALAPAGLRARGPNDRIGIGIIGCGSRGNYLLGETLAAAADRVDIVALADVWSVARETMAKRVARHGRPASAEAVRALPRSARDAAGGRRDHRDAGFRASRRARRRGQGRQGRVRREAAVRAARGRGRGARCREEQHAHRAGRHAAAGAARGSRPPRSTCAPARSAPSARSRRRGTATSRAGRVPWTTCGPRTSTGSSSRCISSGGRSIRCAFAAGNGSTSRPPGSWGSSAAT